MTGFWNIQNIKWNNKAPTVFSRIIAGGDYFFFRTKRGDYSSKAIISNIVHWNSCPKYFVLFIFPLNQKIITSNTLSMGFLRVPNLVLWLIFRAWSVIDQFCWISLALQLDREGIKGREDGQRGGGRGDYSREAIILSISVKGGGGGGVIEGRLLFEEIRYFVFSRIMLGHFTRM